MTDRSFNKLTCTIDRADGAKATIRNHDDQGDALVDVLGMPLYEAVLRSERHGRVVVGTFFNLAAAATAAELWDGPAHLQKWDVEIRDGSGAVRIDQVTAFDLTQATSIAVRKFASAAYASISVKHRPVAA